MKCITMQLITTLFFASTVKAFVERIGINDYFPLITDVHKYYRTSCVIFVHYGNYQDLNISTLLHTWSREFSRRHVMTVTLTFVDLMNEYHKYRKIARALFVVLLDTRETMNEFSITTKSLEYISFPIWLVLFLRYPGNPLEKYCRHPTDNVFNVNFNTEMLVLCYDSPILTEWYAVRDNRTRTYKLATWSSDKGIILMTRQTLHARRNNLFGDVVRVASVHRSPFFLLRNGRIAGFLGALLLELSKVMNFTLDILEQNQTYGSWNQSAMKWTGVIGQVVANEADVGVSDFSVTPRRLDAVDFTFPLMHSRSRLYMKQSSDTEVQWFGYFKVFTYEIWVVIVIMIVCAPLLLSVIKTKKCLSMNLILENYVYVWGIYCQQGLSEFPKEWSMRLAFLSIFISSLIISAAYSASLISYLTLTTPSLPFSTLEGYIADGSYTLIVLQEGSDYDMFHYAKDPILLKMNESMKEKKKLPISELDGFEQVCSERKLAFYTTETLKNIAHSPCNTTFIETGRYDRIAMILQKESPYTGVINYHIQRFLYNGVISRLKERHFSMLNPVKVRYDAVCLRGVVPILAVVAIGTVLGIFILILEKAYYTFSTKSRNDKTLLQKSRYNNLTAPSHIKWKRSNKKNLKCQRFYNLHARPIKYRS